MSAPHAPLTRRVVALVFPHLLCELAERQRGDLLAPSAPIGVVLIPGPNHSTASTPAANTQAANTQLAELPLAEVNEAARRCGLYVGQTVLDAQTQVPRVQIETVERTFLERTLSSISATLKKFSSNVGLNLLSPIPDTIWLDITSASLSLDQEQWLVAELQESVRLLGHTVRAVLAPGPFFARALAHWGELSGQGTAVIQQEELRRALALLPPSILPWPPHALAWLSQLGVSTWGELQKLPPELFQEHLGGAAPALLTLLQGTDQTTWPPCPEPTDFKLELSFKTPLPARSATERVPSALQARLRYLLLQLSARLAAQAQAASHLQLTLYSASSPSSADPAFQKTSSPQAPSSSNLHFSFSPPLWKEEDLFRALYLRLAKLSSLRTVQKMVLQVVETAPRPVEVETPLSPAVREEALLPELIQELQTWLGPQRVGKLSIPDDAPSLEGRSRLIPWSSPITRRKSHSTKSPPTPSESDELSRITRYFSPPVRLPSVFGVGSSWLWGTQLYQVLHIRALQLPPSSLSEDPRRYFWAFLQGPEAPTRVLVSSHPQTGEKYLHGWAD